MRQAAVFAAVTACLNAINGRGIHFRFIASFKLSFKFSPEDRAVRTMDPDDRDNTTVTWDRPLHGAHRVDNGEPK